MTAINPYQRKQQHLRDFGRVCFLMLAFGWIGIVYAETFSECILENMKTVGSERAALQIRTACKQKVLSHIPAACKKDWCNLKRMPPIGDANSSDYLDSILKSDKTIKLTGYEMGDPECKAGPKWFNDSGCIDKCLEASWWSKTFGECKP